MNKKPKKKKKLTYEYMERVIRETVLVVNERLSSLRNHAPVEVAAKISHVWSEGFTLWMYDMEKTEKKGRIVGHFGWVKESPEESQFVNGLDCAICRIMHMVDGNLKTHSSVMVNSLTYGQVASSIYQVIKAETTPGDWSEVLEECVEEAGEPVKCTYCVMCERGPGEGVCYCAELQEIERLKSENETLKKANVDLEDMLHFRRDMAKLKENKEDERTHD